MRVGRATRGALARVAPAAARRTLARRRCHGLVFTRTWRNFGSPAWIADRAGLRADAGRQLGPFSLRVSGWPLPLGAARPARHGRLFGATGVLGCSLGLGAGGRARFRRARLA